MPKAQKIWLSNEVHEEKQEEPLTNEEQIKKCLEDIAGIKNELIEKYEGDIFSQSIISMVEQIGTKDFSYDSDETKEGMYEFFESVCDYESDKSKYLSHYINSPTSFIVAANTCVNGEPINQYLGFGNRLDDYDKAIESESEAIVGYRSNISEIRDILKSYAEDGKELPEEITSLLIDSDINGVISYDTILNESVQCIEDGSLVYTNIYGASVLEEIEYDGDTIKHLGEKTIDGIDKEIEELESESEEIVETEDTDELEAGE